MIYYVMWRGCLNVVQGNTGSILEVVVMLVANTTTGLGLIDSMFLPFSLFHRSVSSLVLNAINAPYYCNSLLPSACPFLLPTPILHSYGPSRTPTILSFCLLHRPLLTTHSHIPFKPSWILRKGRNEGFPQEGRPLLQTPHQCGQIVVSPP